MDWHAQFLQPVAAAPKDLDTMNAFAQQSRFPHSLDSDRLVGGDMTALNKVHNLAHAKSLKLVTIIEASFPESSLGETKFHATLAALESARHGATSRVGAFVASTGCFATNVKID